MAPSVGIAGAGLIGGAVALRAAELGWTVGVFDTVPEHGRYAVERLGASFAAASLAELAARSDTLVLAAPLGATLAHLAELARALPPNVALVVDVASVKVPVSRAGAGVRGFVATHPIAGSERSGPAAARADLFAGRVWTVDADAPDDDRSRAVAFVEAMGARPVAIACAEHDRVAALTSHLPQVVSTALASHLAPELDAPHVRALCGTGIRSVLRLAGSSWTVWEAVLHANAIPLAQEVRRLAAILTEVAGDLERDAPRGLERRFAQAASVAGILSNPDL